MCDMDLYWLLAAALGLRSIIGGTATETELKTLEILQKKESSGR